MIFRIFSPFYAAAAAIRAFWAKIAGYEVLADAETQENRLDECEMCVNLTESRQCSICTCFVDAKTMISTEKCPKGYWKARWVKKIPSK